MANTYTQLYIQTVFAVQGRHNLLPPKTLPELFRYSAGIVERRGHKVLAVGGMPDHLHLFIGLNPSAALSDLVRDVKAASSSKITEKRWVQGVFRWQEGYGAFSYSRSHIAAVCRYVQNQESHHRRRTFREEYLKLLSDFEVKYNEQYLFEWIE